MGLMFGRRRADQKKLRDANKAKAHAENHKAAIAKEKALHQSAPAPAPAAPAKEAVSNGSDKPGAK